MKILFTTPVLEHPAAGGPQLRIENSIKALHSVAELHIISRAPMHEMGGPNAEQYYKQYCSSFSYVPSLRGPSNRYLRKIREIGLRMLNKWDVDFILSYVEHNQIDIVWFGYGNISYELMKEIKTRQPSLKIVCDTDSVWSRYILRELPYASSAGRRKEIEESGMRKEREEADWVEFCDVTTAVSKVDAAYYRGIATHPERIKVFSNVIDLENYDLRPEPPAKLKKPCIYLAGSFWPGSPMEKAARWVIDEVLPLIKKQIPDISFYIIGRGSDIVLHDIKDENIIVTGKLDSVLPFLCNADVALVPLMFESGTRFKILEAGACGIPIVSTTLGAEGIPVENGENIFIADTPLAFSSAILMVINNPPLAQKLAKNCKQLIRDKYSVTALADEAREIIGFLEESCGRTNN